MRGAILIWAALAGCVGFNESSGRGGVQGQHRDDQRPDDHDNDGTPDYLEARPGEPAAPEAPPPEAPPPK
jgi:hypothetical protein